MSAEPGLRFTDAQRFDWLRLWRTESIGPRTFRILINRFGSARAALFYERRQEFERFGCARYQRAGDMQRSVLDGTHGSTPLRTIDLSATSIDTQLQNLPSEVGEANSLAYRAPSIAREASA